MVLRWSPVLVLVLVVAVAACGDAPDEAPAGAADEVEAEPADYQAFFAGALTDTLRGDARFGRVVDGRTGARRFVIALRTPGNLVGGLILARGVPDVPEEGRHDVASYADSTGRPPEDFLLVYRDGMRREFSSTSGTLTLTTVRDTLLEGSFSATLEGVAVRSGGPPIEGTTTVQGHFQARSGSVGFILGL